VKKVDEKTGEEQTVSKTEFNVSGESDVKPSEQGEIKIDAEASAAVAQNVAQIESKAQETK